MTSPVLAVVAPGQGSQAPGMLSAWLEVPAARAAIEAVAAATGIADLVATGTEGTADDVRPTQVAQPLIMAASLASAAALTGGDPAALPAQLVAGHSVGEWSAAVLAGALPLETAASLLGVRAAAMGRAAGIVAPSGMAAVLGGDESVVLPAIAAANLVAANVNGAGQIVAAGLLTDVDAFVADPPAGARVRKLDVAAAFHHPLMEPAVAELAAAAAAVTPAEPARTFVGNAAGLELTTGADVVAGMVAQVSLPVRWDLVQERLKTLGVTAVLELAPAGVLTGLAKRALPGVAIFALKSPADLDAARAFLAEHAGVAA